jgi:hypothetical protein
LPFASDPASTLGPPAENGSPWAVRVEGLSVTYRTTVQKRPTLKGTLKRLGRRKRIIK